MTLNLIFTEEFFLKKSSFSICDDILNNSKLVKSIVNWGAYRTVYMWNFYISVLTPTYALIVLVVVGT